MASPRPAAREPPSTAGLDRITLDRYQSLVPESVLAQRREEILKTPNLLDVLNVDALQPIIQDPKFQEKLPSLLEHLPEQDRSAENLIQVLRSPSLRGQVMALSNALHSGHANEILSSFGLPSSSEQQVYQYGLKQFYDALMKYQRDKNKDS